MPPVPIRTNWVVHTLHHILAQVSTLVHGLTNAVYHTGGQNKVAADPAIFTRSPPTLLSMKSGDSTEFAPFKSLSPYPPVTLAASPQGDVATLDQEGWMRLESEKILLRVHTGEAV